MRFSNRVRFKPYIGSNYRDSSPKTLILGESAYGKDLDGDSVNWFIESTKHGEWNYAYFTKIPYIVSKPQHFDDNLNLDKDLFWNSVCFHEYIQEPLKAARERPTQTMWENAARIFPEILNKIEPEVIACFGFDLYDHVIEAFHSESKVIKRKVKGDVLETGSAKLTVDGKSAFICRLLHPSAPGFSYEPWIYLFDRFLQDSGFDHFM